MKIIGIGHYSRVGKDTFANLFVGWMQQYGLSILKRSFAWKLKQVAHELYAWAGLREPEYYETPDGALARKVVLPALGKTPVEIWVDFGTKAVRNNVYDRTWVDCLLKSDLGADHLVIPDVRFLNEVEAIKEAGGTLIKVVRPGYGPLDTVADRALLGYDGWDYVIGDEGSIASLSEWARSFAISYATGAPPCAQTPEARRQALVVEVLP